MASDGTIRIDVELDDRQARDGIEGISRDARSIDDSQASKLSSTIGALGKTAAIAVAGIAGISAGAFALARPLVEAAGAAQALNSQFSQVFGELETEATRALNNIGEETNILPTRLQGTFAQIAAFARTTGASTADALDLTTRATIAAADSAAFYDRSIEETTESLQSFLKGNFENDAALGISATETTRNAIANELYGKSFRDLDESQKQLALLALVEQGNELSGALGQAAREGEGLENVTGNLRQSFTDLQARLGERILEPAIEGIVALTTFIQNIDIDAIINTITNGFQRVVDFSQPFIEAIQNAFNVFVTDILPIVITVVQEIFDFIVDVFSQIVSFYQENGAQILESIQNVWGFIYDVFQFFLPAIEFVVRFVWDSIKMVITGALDVILGAVRFFSSLFTGDFSGLWDAVVQIFSGAIDLILGLMNLSFVGGLRALAVNFIRTFAGFFRNLWDDILGLFVNGTSRVINTVSGWVTSVLQFITNLVNGGRQFISDFVSRGVSSFRSFADDVISAVRNLPSQFIEIGKNVISGFIDGIKSLNPISAVTGVFNSVKDTVKGIFDINSPSKWARDEIVGSIAEGFDAGAVKYRSEFEFAGANIAADVQNPFGGPSPTFDLNSSSLNYPQNNNGSSGQSNTIINNFNQAESTPYESARKQEEMLRRLALEF